MPSKQPDVPPCSHHWEIEGAEIRSDGSSLGVCKLCKAERMFRNTLDAANEDPRHVARAGAGGLRPKRRAGEIQIEEDTYDLDQLLQRLRLA